MNKQLKDRFALIKQRLEQQPDSPVFGEMAAPVRSADTLVKLAPWHTYHDFLMLANGARLGSIDVWSADEVEQQQWRLNDWQAGSDAWLCVGQILYNPLFLEAGTNRLILFMDETPYNTIFLGTFDTFLLNVALGAEYCHTIPNGEQDEWWAIIAPTMTPTAQSA